MRVIIENGLVRESSNRIYHFIRDRLTECGYDVTYIYGLNETPVDVERHDILVSNKFVDDDVRRRIRSWGGVRMSRPATLRMLEACGVPVMRWALAQDRAEVAALFDRWNAERLLLKRSGSFGGKGVSAFRREHIDGLKWKAAEDIFCPEVNPDSGDIFKAELFNGRLIISWQSASPPLRELCDEGVLTGIRGAYGERSLFTFPDEVTLAMEGLSRYLAQAGIGYVSVDLMRAPGGAYEAIEINLEDVAAWWTSQFDFVRERYAEAAQDLLRAARILDTLPGAAETAYWQRRSEAAEEALDALRKSFTWRARSKLLQWPAVRGARRLLGSKWRSGKQE